MMLVNRTKLTLFLVIFTCSFAYAQRSDLGQIILGDTVVSNAYISFPANWPAGILARFPGNEHYDIFSAGEITQFVLGTAEIFRAKPIITNDGTRKMVFMQLLSGGSIDLYHSIAGAYTFYIQKEDLIPLTHDIYRETVTDLVTGDKLAHKASQRVLYRKNSLRHYFQQYNKDRLHDRPFPMPHAGVYFQFNSMRWNVPQYVSTNVRFSSFDLPVNHFSPGLFLHVPFYDPKRLGVDLRFISHTYETTTLVDESISGSYFKDIYFENFWMQADLALRYTFGWGSFEPYMAFGFSYLHSVKQHSQIFYFLIQDGHVNSHFLEGIYEEPSLMFGAMINQGIQYYVLPRTVLAAEWGYGQYLDASGSGYGMNNLFISMKLNFWPW